jgi:hypothetical protein
MVMHRSEHCVLANERGFILVVRSGHCLQLSKAYSTRPSTPEETCEMMTHLSYFIALGLCKRYPFNDKDVIAASPPPGKAANPNTASSSSAPSAKPGTTKTHAKTDSQATIRGPVNATMMVRVQ